MTIAETILQQLGGKRFILMTGSKQFVDGGDYLKFKLAANILKAQYLQIKLTAMDDYTMTFFSLDKDMLQDIFTSKTGLYTHL
ncbi:MAG: hypothetical protein ACTHLE_07265 [Agriterribacter sp.]